MLMLSSALLGEAVVDIDHPLGDSLSCRNFPWTLTTSTLAAQTSRAVSDWASETPKILTKMELSQDFPPGRTRAALSSLLLERAFLGGFCQC